MIFSMSSLLSGLKNTCSSTLLMNSGGKAFLTAFSSTVFLLTAMFLPAVLNPTPLPYSSSSRLPTLEVMMRIVFLKLTVLPLLSVSLPSSITWSRRLNTSGCAFSISSKSTTQYGLRLTRSLSWPPSSNPTYPGGAPMSLDTLNFSMYSLMSSLTILSSESNRYSASDLAS